MLIIRRNEDALIDGMRVQTDAVSSVVVQGDNPGEHLQNVGESRPAAVPDPTVGGRNGSGVRNGYRNGFLPRMARFAKFDGRVAKLPKITNPVQGEVGKNAREQTLYQGVANQFVQYRADSGALARSVTGV